MPVTLVRFLKYISVIHIIPSYKSSVLLLLLLLLLLWNCCTILDLCLKYEIMDGFWSSRCLNNRIDLPDKIGSFSSGATTSMVVKNGTKKLFEGFYKCLKCFICSKHVSRKWL